MGRYNGSGSHKEMRFMQVTIEKVEDKCAEVTIGGNSHIKVDKKILPANIRPNDIIEIYCYKDREKKSIEPKNKKKGLFW